MNLNNDKLVIEELLRMKSLFGYERGRIISEQGNMSGTAGVGMTGPFMPSPSSPIASSQTQQQFGQFMSRAGQVGFEDYPIVDCTNYIKVPQVSPGGKAQKEFEKNSGLNPNSEENKKYYCSSEAMNSYLQQQKQQQKHQQKQQQKQQKKPVTPPQIPTELKDINGVKAFQDWLDTNKKGWASGYANGILNKIGKGYGRMGPRTNKAWSIPKIKDEYLNPTDKVEPITSQEIKQINVDTEPKSDLGTQSPVTNTTTTTSTETISQYPPSEPGQPGEYKDGWYYDEKSQQWYKPQ